MTLPQLLLSLLILSLIVWVGGAVTGQIIVARALATDKTTFAANMIPYVNWIIPHVYIPAAVTAATSGLVLAYLQNVPFTTPWLLFLLVVFVATNIMGSVYSLPEYRRLTRMLEERGPRDEEIQRRLVRASWLNRVELLLIVMGLVGVIAQTVTFSTP